MAQQKGSTAKLILGFETTFKTLPTVGYNLPFNSSGIRANRPKNQPATMRGRRDPTQPFDGNLAISGPIVVPVDSAAMPYWLTAMFGDPVTTGAGPYVHEWKIANDMPSFAIEHQFADLATAKYDQFKGLKVAGFSIETGGDGEYIMNIDIFGADQGLASSAFDAAPTDIVLSRLKNFQATIEEGGSALGNGNRLTINVDFGLDRDQYDIGGAGVIGAIPEGITGINGNLITRFIDSTLLDKAEAGTESSLKITATGAANSVFELEIEELEYERNSVPVDGPTGLRADLAFQGFFANGAEDSAIVARVTNDIVSYDLVP